MLKKSWCLIFTFLTLMSSAGPATKLVAIVLDSQDVPAPPPWLIDTMPEGYKPSILEDVMLAYRARDYSACVRKADVALTKFKDLAPWIYRQQLVCANEGLEKLWGRAPAESEDGAGVATPPPTEPVKTAKNSGKKAAKTKSENLNEGKGVNANIGEATLTKVLANPRWLVHGPAATPLRKEVIRNLSLRLVADGRSANRARAWQAFEQLAVWENELSADDRSEMLRIAGDLAFAEQNWDVAAQLYERSLRYRSNRAVQEKLGTLRATLGMPPTPAKPAWSSNPEIDATPEELKLYNRAMDAQRSGEWIAALDDGVKLLENYPSGVRATEINDRIIENFLTILSQGEEKSLPVKSQYLKHMRRAHSLRQLEWGRKCLNRGYITEALALGESAYSSLESSPHASNVLELLVRSSWYSGDDSAIEKYLPMAQSKVAGTSLSAETLLVLGLWEYSRGHYSQSAFQLERLLMTPQGESHELTARYWLWRALKKNNNAMADTHAHILLSKYPFTYYGLRARSEIDGAITWDFKPTRKTVKWYLLPHQKQQFDQMRLLLKSGWWEAAQASLKDLPSPTEPTARALWALYVARVMDTPRAVQILNESWDLVPDLRNPPFVTTVFSKNFSKLIDKTSRTKNVSPLLVRSLIKQESAFFPMAKSSSGALGLMQLMPATAKEVAKNVGLKGINIPEDVYQTEINVELGTTYIRDMVQKFQNHVPLALAAYNAGPTRLARWLKNHPQHKNLASQKSSPADGDIWIEQLPWSETRGYVKSILRNAWMFELIDKGRIQLTDPIWAPLLSDGQAATASL